MNRLLGFIGLVLLFAGCRMGERSISPEVLSLAGDNAGQLQVVVRHYRGEPEKERAALFLINNMAHGYNVSKASALFRERVFASEARKVAEYNHLWLAVDSLGPKGISRRLDARTLTSGFLIGHIDRAYDAWKSAPWGGQIGFETFCDSLVYEAPAGALYWLRNLTEGREERIFSYENGRQVWW